MMPLADVERAALDLVAAMLANVSEDLRAAAISCQPDGFTLHFVLWREVVGDRTDIDDIVAEFAALQPTNVRIDVDIRRHDEVIDYQQIPGHYVYLRRDKRFY